MCKGKKPKVDTIREWTELFTVFAAFVVAVTCFFGAIRIISCSRKSIQTSTDVISKIGQTTNESTPDDPGNMNENLEVTAGNLMEYKERMLTIQKNSLNNDLLSFIYGVMSTLLVGLCAYFVEKSEKSAREARENVVLIQSKLEIADNLVNNATKKADEANNKATLADKNASIADTKASQAEQKAKEVEQQVKEAENKAYTAEFKSNIADQIASEASRKANEVDRKTSVAESKASGAEEKAKEAENKANGAEKKAKEAENKASEAESNAQKANETVQIILNGQKQLLEELKQANQQNVKLQNSVRILGIQASISQARIGLISNKNLSYWYLNKIETGVCSLTKEALYDRETVQELKNELGILEDVIEKRVRLAKRKKEETLLKILNDYKKKISASIDHCNAILTVIDARSQT